MVEHGIAGTTNLVFTHNGFCIADSAGFGAGEIAGGSFQGNGARQGGDNGACDALAEAVLGEAVSVVFLGGGDVSGLGVSATWGEAAFAEALPLVFIGGGNVGCLCPCAAMGEVVLVDCSFSLAEAEALSGAFIKGVGNAGCLGFPFSLAEAEALSVAFIGGEGDAGGPGRRATLASSNAAPVGGNDGCLGPSRTLAGPASAGSRSLLFPRFGGYEGGLCVKLSEVGEAPSDSEPTALRARTASSWAITARNLAISGAMSAITTDLLWKLLRENGHI